MTKNKFSLGGLLTLIVAFALVLAGCDDLLSKLDPLAFANSPSFNIPSGTVNTAITDIYVGGSVSGGTSPYSFTATGLPAGITISPAGLISGTPTTVVAAGTATITVTDSAGGTKSITISYGAITAAVSGPGTLTFTDSDIFNIPESTVGTGITPIYVGGGVSGGTAPYSFTATGLPAGISITQAGQTAGLISGTPTTAAAAGQATITVTDSATPNASQSITISYGTIAAAGSGPATPSSPLTFTDSDAFNISASTVGTAITPIYVGIGVSGGTVPYTFAATGLPAGISITQTGQTAGFISGTPTTVAAAGQATITVTDSATPNATQTITINYGTITASDPGPGPGPSNPLTFTDSDAFNIPAGTVGTAITGINVAPGVSGGSLPYSFTATGLPAGISISATGTISGTPPTPSGAGTATITVTDSANASQNITISYGEITAGSGGPVPSDPLTFTPSPSFNIPESTVGKAIEPINVASGVSGGTSPYSFTADGLPADISISPDGLISGTPATAATAGTAQIIVSDATGTYQSITISYGDITAGSGGHGSDDSLDGAENWSQAQWQAWFNNHPFSESYLEELNIFAENYPEMNNSWIMAMVEAWVLGNEPGFDGATRWDTAAWQAWFNNHPYETRYEIAVGIFLASNETWVDSNPWLWEMYFEWAGIEIVKPGPGGELDGATSWDTGTWQAWFNGHSASDLSALVVISEFISYNYEWAMGNSWWYSMYTTWALGGELDGATSWDTGTWQAWFNGHSASDLSALAAISEFLSYNYEWAKSNSWWYSMYDAWVLGDEPGPGGVLDGATSWSQAEWETWFNEHSVSDMSALIAVSEFAESSSLWLANHSWWSTLYATWVLGGSGSSVSLDGAASWDQSTWQAWFSEHSATDLSVLMAVSEFLSSNSTWAIGTSWWYTMYTEWTMAAVTDIPGVVAY
jgi:hypothetical protein